MDKGKGERCQEEGDGAEGHRLRSVRVGGEKAIHRESGWGDLALSTGVKMSNIERFGGCAWKLFQLGIG